MYFASSLINKKFVSVLVKKGKKFKIEKLFYNFYYNLNKFLFHDFLYFTKIKKSRSRNKIKKPYFLNLVLENNAIETNSSLSFFLDWRQSIYKKLRFKNLVKQNSFFFNEPNLNLDISNYVKIKYLKKKINKKFIFNINKLCFYYTLFSKSMFSFLVSYFLNFQILYSLIPFMGIRMVSIGRLRSKKNRKKQKLIGIPIILKPIKQVTYAVGFFRKAILKAREEVKKSKNIESSILTDSFNDEMLHFMFNKTTESLGLKTALYTKIVDNRLNAHFRWLM